MKFYADENINSAIVKGLDMRGFDVLEISGSEKSGLSDSRHLKIAEEEKRVIITADDDFLRLEDDNNHSGIIFLANQEVDVGESIRRISKISDLVSDEEMENHVEFI